MVRQAIVSVCVTGVLCGSGTAAWADEPVPTPSETAPTPAPTEPTPTPTPTPTGLPKRLVFGESRKGTPIGHYDVLIAGHARSRGLVLVSNNLREFERVDGLRLENWADGGGAW